MRDEFIGGIFGFELVGRLAYHEGFGLGKEVGREHFLVLVVFDGVVRFGGEDEVCGDELGALVEELVEGVLGVGGGLAEEDGPSGVFYHCAVAGDGFAVGFHRELLKVGWEAVEVLVESTELGNSSLCRNKRTYGETR